MSENIVTKIVGKILEKDVIFTSYQDQKVVQITLGKLDVIISQLENGKVNITVDNHEEKLTLSGYLDDSKKFEWY